MTDPDIEPCKICNGLGSQIKKYPGTYDFFWLSPPDIEVKVSCKYCMGSGLRKNINPRIMDWDAFRRWTNAKD